MIEVYEYEAQDEEACYEKCIEDLDVYSSDILVESEENESLYKMKVVKKEDIMNYIKSYINLL